MSGPNASEKVNLRQVVFLDRDGVMIEDRPDYVRSMDDVSVFPEALKAAQIISSAGYGIIVVSNQSGIGKGIVSYEAVSEIFETIVQEFRDHGANILAWYMCPHHPDKGCECRKPKAGMIFQAAEEWSVDLHRSVLVGDALRDLQAAEAAGVTGKLVRTGLGRSHESEVLVNGSGRWTVHEDLLDAVPSILSFLQESH